MPDPQRMKSLSQDTRSSMGARNWLYQRALCALAVFSVLIASTAPSPLYPPIVERLGLSHAAITGIYSTYAAGTLITLLLLGAVGNRMRDPRQLLVPGLLLSGIGATLFGIGSTPELLFIGRFISGIATGLVTGTATSALFEIANLRPAQSDRGRTATVSTIAFTAGAAFGPVLSSTALALDFYPFVFPFVFIALLSLANAVGFLMCRWPPRAAPETGPTPARASGQSIENRKMLAIACIGVCSVWCIASLIMAVSAEVATNLFMVQSAALAGGLVPVFQLFAGTGQYLFGNKKPRSALAIGASGFGAIQLVLWFAGQYTLPVLFYAMMPLCGLCYGGAFVAALKLARQSSFPGHQLRAVSYFYFSGYIANALPVLAFGAAVDAYGLAPTFFATCAITAFFAIAIGLVALRVLPGNDGR